MQFRMGDRLVSIDLSGPRPSFLTIREGLPPVPMLSGPGCQLPAKQRRTKPPTPATHAANVQPTPATVTPATTRTEESTMTKSTTAEKIERINAFLKGANQPMLSIEAAERLLKANEMSPKRVIRNLRENLPKPEGNKLHDAVKPKAEAPAAPAAAPAEAPAADPVAAAIAKRAEKPADKKAGKRAATSAGATTH